MVVASAGMIGIGRDDVRAVLHLLHSKGIPLLDASTRKTIMWSDEVADNLAFLDRAEKEYKALVTAKARASRREGRPKKVLKVSEEEAHAMWRDTVRYPSQKQVADAVGLSVRAMYSKYKKRHPIAPPPKKKPAPIVAPDGHNFIYVMWRSDGCHKIGFSRNLTVRLKVLSDIMKQPLKLVHYELRPGDANPAEWYAHHLLRDRRRDGEWFEVDEATAIWATGQYEVKLQKEREWKKISDIQAQRRALIGAEEERIGREMTRVEINAFMKARKTQDETDY